MIETIPSLPPLIVYPVLPPKTLLTRIPKKLSSSVRSWPDHQPERSVEFPQVLLKQRGHCVSPWEKSIVLWRWKLKGEKILENDFYLLFSSLADYQLRKPRGIITAMEAPRCLSLPGRFIGGTEVLGNLQLSQQSSCLRTQRFPCLPGAPNETARWRLQESPAFPRDWPCYLFSLVSPSIMGCHFGWK